MAPRNEVAATGYGRRRLLRNTFAAAALAGAAAAPVPALALSPPQPRHLLALGDSLTAGFGLLPGEGFVPRLEAAMQRIGRPVQVGNAGVSGDTSAGGLRRLDWALQSGVGRFGPVRAAILELGANDGLRGLPPRQMRANLEAILDRLAARGVATLLAGMQAPPNFGADYAREFAAVFSGLAAARPALVFYPFFLDGVAGDPALNLADRLHPNARGIEVIVQRIQPHVVALLDRIPPE